MLTREQLLAPCERRIEAVKFRKGEIFLKEMSARELMAFQRSIEGDVRSKRNGAADPDQDAFAAKLVARCVCDKDGQRAMNDEDWKLVLEKWSSSEMQSVFPVVTRLNGYGSAEGNV